EDAEEAFDGVGVDFRVEARDVFGLAVVDGAMGGDLFGDAVIPRAFIGDDAGLADHVRGDNPANGFDVHVIHDHRARTTRLTVDQAHDLHLVRATTGDGGIGLAADVGF